MTCRWVCVAIFRGFLRRSVEHDYSSRIVQQAIIAGPEADASPLLHGSSNTAPSLLREQQPATTGGYRDTLVMVSGPDEVSSSPYVCDLHVRFE